MTTAQEKASRPVLTPNPATDFIETLPTAVLRHIKHQLNARCWGDRRNRETLIHALRYRVYCQPHQIDTIREYADRAERGE